VALLSSAQLNALQGGLSSLTQTQAGKLTSAQLAALSAATLNAASTTFLGYLSATQLGQLSATTVSGLSAPLLNGLTAAQLGELTQVQTQALTATQVSGLTVAKLAALNSAWFGAQQAAGLTVAQISAMTVQQFDSLCGNNLASLSANVIKALSIAQLQSLTAIQDGQFTAAQLAMMSAAQLAVVQAVNPILAKARSLAVAGTLTYNAMLKILQDAAAGGVTSTEFSGLKTLANELNVTGGYQTTAYVQQIFDDVVLGNSANAYWHGGAATATALGNLAAGSSVTQASELIAKWFLGTDLPSADLSAVGSSLKSTYAACTLPLFGANGPQWTDVNQGVVGDCYFLSALAETALQHPDTISNMIKSNGNGTYSVEFIVNGKADYVTVDSELAMLPNGYSWQNGAKQTFDHNASNMWSQLIEKAYVQLVEQTGVTPGMTLNVNGNATSEA